MNLRDYEISGHPDRISRARLSAPGWATGCCSRPPNGLRGQLDALDAWAADRDAAFKLASGLEGFLCRLHGTAATATVEESRRLRRLLVKDVLVGPEQITICYRIPIREPAGSGGSPPQPTRRVTCANVMNCGGGVTNNLTSCKRT